MGDGYPSISTDQVGAFAELARCGNIRTAARSLRISEQGLRNRLLALEGRLGVDLYRKSRGPRQVTPLTPRGVDFLHEAHAFLERARRLGEFAGAGAALREVHVAASQYLLVYVLIDAVRRFARARPDVPIRLSTHREQDVEEVLARDPGVALGLAAPGELSTRLEYRHIFSMDWSLIVPPRHRLAGRKRVRLREIEGEPLILFEHGSTGRQHILEAFGALRLTPRIQMETTTTQTIVRMVEAGLGLSIVPLLASGVVTRGHRLGVLAIADPIRPIHSGVLIRRGETLSLPTRELLEFIRQSRESK